MTIFLNVKHLNDPRIHLTIDAPLTFSVKSGEALYVVGPNGSGKSTLLNLIAGIYPLQKGSIESKPSFYCGHETGLKESLSIQENIDFRCNVFGKRTKEEQEKALAIFHLDKIKKRLVGTLSAGQKRQVALVSGVLSKKPLWVLDEPFSNLDIKAKDIFKELLKDHLQKGGAAIIAAHDFLKEEKGCYLELR
ncbi:MAG: heme ABC exporter ATP-binding protein CcmA [Alphaproteobacteria bacterium]|nr:heme ABC exporter ATP-binding protein CcmA [Alphaproteobacteria bacterium]